MNCFCRSKMTHAPFISGINNISDTAILGSHRVTMDVCGNSYNCPRRSYTPQKGTQLHARLEASVYAMHASVITCSIADKF